MTNQTNALEDIEMTVGAYNLLKGIGIHNVTDLMGVDSEIILNSEKSTIAKHTEIMALITSLEKEGHSSLAETQTA